MHSHIGQTYDFCGKSILLLECLRLTQEFPGTADQQDVKQCLDFSTPLALTHTRHGNEKGQQPFGPKG